jgi:hypothetical protein
VDDKRCPICGKGILQHLGTEGPPGEQEQRADTPILETYSCGHTVTEPGLDSADAEILEVERRTSEDVVDPPAETGYRWGER